MKATTPQTGMTMLPGRPGTCRACFVKHEPEMPHNAQSLSYGMRFLMRYGRSPTWADAIAHCDQQMQAYWRDALQEKGHWTEPPAGIDPIAEPMEVQP